MDDVKIDQVLDIRILKQFLAKDDSRLNIINIGTLTISGNNGGEFPELQFETLDHAIWELLERLPNPKFQSLRTLVYQVCAQRLGSKRKAATYLGLSESTVRSYFTPTKIKDHVGKLIEGRE